MSEESSISCPYCDRGESCEDVEHFKNQIRYATVAIQNMIEGQLELTREEAKGLYLSTMFDVASDTVPPEILSAQSKLRAFINQETDEDATYEKPFREKVCPVPDFPGTGKEKA